MNDWKALRKGTNLDANTEWHYCCFSMKFKELKQEMPQDPEWILKLLGACRRVLDSAPRPENTEIKTSSLS